MTTHLWLRWLSSSSHQSLLPAMCDTWIQSSKSPTLEVINLLIQVWWLICTTVLIFGILQYII